MTSAASQASRLIRSDSGYPLDVEDQLSEILLQAQLAAAAESEAQSIQQQQQQQQVSQPHPRLCQRLRYYKPAVDDTRTPVVLRYSVPRPDASPLQLAMKQEIKRLVSFKPILTAQTKRLCVQLAHEGFFHEPDAGTQMSVRCAFCGGCVSDWQSEESADRVHRQLFSTCPFVLGMDVGNVPIPAIVMQPLAKQPVQCSESSSDYTWTAERTAASAEQVEVECQILRSGVSHRFSNSLGMGSFRAVTYRVDNEDIQQRYDLPEVQAVTRLIGLAAKDVQDAVHKQLLTTGDDYESTQDLAMVAWELAVKRLSRAPAAEAVGVGSVTAETVAAETVAEETAAADTAAEETAAAETVAEETATCATTKILPAAGDSPWNQCRVCMVDKIDVVLLRCGHHCCCSGCATFLKICPICRAEIVATLTINSK